MVFEVFGNEEEVLEEVEGGLEGVEFLLVLVFVEDGGVVGQVDVLDVDFAGFLVHHAPLFLCAVRLYDEGSVGLGRVHLDLLPPVVLETVQHLALVQS